MAESSAQRASKVSDEEILSHVQLAMNLRQLLLALGLAAYGGNYETMRKRLTLLGVNDARFHPRPRSSKPRQFTYPELVAAARRSDSYAEMLRVLSVPWTASEHRRLKTALASFGINTSHFVGQAHNRGQRFPGRGAPLEDVLVAGKITSTITLKRRLLEAGLLMRCCAICQHDEWNGEPIPLELDHINGDRADNRLENLRLLCPNCHAQTPTYRGRNIGRVAEVPLLESAPLPDLAGDAARRLRSILSMPRVA